MNREAIIKKVTNAVSQWREIAAKTGITKKEIQRMEDAFI
jgi:hypothetical protein